MDKQLKEDWVKALRSGKYEQGQDYLCDEARYCCLGVLCEIHPEVTKKVNGAGVVTFTTPLGEIPDEEFQLHQLEFFGLQSIQQHKLVHMNDGTGGEPRRSFSYIADYIEQDI